VLLTRVLASAAQLQGKTDQRFTEAAFRCLRECLHVKSVLSPAQFLEQVRGNTRSIMFCSEMACGREGSYLINLSPLL
jgi:hypothetical protein